VYVGVANQKVVGYPSRTRKNPCCSSDEIGSDESCLTCADDENSPSVTQGKSVFKNLYFEHDSAALYEYI